MGTYLRKIIFLILPWACTSFSYQDFLSASTKLIQALYIYLNLCPSSMNCQIFIILHFLKLFSAFSSEKYIIINLSRNSLLLGLLWDFHNEPSSLFFWKSTTILSVTLWIYYGILFRILMDFLLFGNTYNYLGLSPLTWGFRIFWLHYIM